MAVCAQIVVWWRLFDVREVGALDVDAVFSACRREGIRVLRVDLYNGAGYFVLGMGAQGAQAFETILPLVARRSFCLN